MRSLLVTTLRMLEYLDLDGWMADSLLSPADRYFSQTIIPQLLRQPCDPCDPHEPEVIEGEYHSFRLDPDGSLYARGSNYRGQLGLGDFDTRDTYTLVPLLEAVRQVAVGSYHSVLVTISGLVYVCGSDSHGQLGLGNNSRQTQFTLVPMSSPILQISAPPQAYTDPETVRTNEWTHPTTTWWTASGRGTKW